MRRSAGATKAAIQHELEMRAKSRNAAPNDLTLGQEGGIQTFQPAGAGSAAQHLRKAYQTASQSHAQTYSESTSHRYKIERSQR